MHPRGMWMRVANPQPVSRAASLPGAELFVLRILTFFEQATCPGQLRCLGQNFSQETDFQEFWDSCAQNKTSEISKNALSGIRGLLCAEQNVGNLKFSTNVLLGILGLLERRTKRRKSRQLLFQQLWDSCPQNKTSEISTRGSPSWATIGILGDL